MAGEGRPPTSFLHAAQQRRGWPAFEAVIQFKFNAVPPTSPKSAVNGGRFSRPVGELTTRELVKAILKGPFCKRGIAGRNWITASFAGHDTGAGSGAGAREVQASGGAAAIGISRASGWSPMPAARVPAPPRLRRWLAAVVAALVWPPLVLAVPLLLALLRRLVHRVQDAEIVLGVLEIALRHHPVAGAGRVAAELQVFLEQLLGGAADADVGAVAVEHVVAVERDAAGVMADRTASSATAAASTTASTAARTMATSTHTFHVHAVAVTLSRLQAMPGSGGTHRLLRGRPGDQFPSA